MKLLIISEFFPTGKELEFSGGVEARNYFLAKYLAKKHSVTIVTTRQTKSKKKEVISKINVIRVGKGTSYKAHASAFMSRINFIRLAIAQGSEIKPDIVEGTNFITHYIALKISKKNNIPVVAWYPDVWIGRWFKNAGVVGLLGEVIERYNLLHKFNAYIAISNQTATKLKKYAKSKIFVINCGVDVAEFKSIADRPKDLKILTISRLVKYKNIRDLILATALLTSEGKKINLTIIGRGPEENSLRELTRQLRLKERIEFKSNLSRSDLITEIKSASIFCLPSSVEGFGIAVLESSACGVPTVLPDTPVFQEVTRNWHGSLKFPVNNITALSGQLRKLLENKKLYASKSKEAILLANHYSWEEIANKTELVYKEALINQ